ncbi:MAG: 1-acyl-sn-glycerol-3-phosphate acyltransferase [Anaerolineales bacterium]|nr:1-acyl-sn-glycerol-3-phosphate acyltransferase [Anaerolineales bacterium]
MSQSKLGPPTLSPNHVWIGRAILKLFGWKVVGEVPQIPKFVGIFAPHTANVDTLLMLAVAFALNIRASIFMKEEAFIGPMGNILRLMGGVPIRRSAHTNRVATTAMAIKNQKQIVVGVPPEGTRSRTEYWRSGFYHIAYQAEVPIVLTFLDFSRKEAGIGSTIYPSGDIHADMQVIAEFYKDKAAKNPEKFGPVRVRPDALPANTPRVTRPLQPVSVEPAHAEDRQVLREAG